MCCHSRHNRQKRMKYFCLLTTGRSGSTSLINALAAHGDIVTPDKLTESPDNELLHPEWVGRYVKFFQQYSQVPISNELQLIQAFFAGGQTMGAKYIGFKSMPNRHRQLHALTAHPDIQIITLVRRDVPSTVASFLMAMRRGTWRRNGEKQQHKLVFDKSLEQQALGNLQYVLQSERQLTSVQNAIHLNFEDLCQDNYCHPQLDAFFERPVKLISPKKPVSAQSYVENWPEFNAFIEKHSQAIRSS